MSRARGGSMRWVRAGLSLYLVFHLFCVVMIPNTDTPPGLKLQRFLAPYAFFMEFTNTWGFFAPDPQVPIYVEYELSDARGEAFDRGQWPEAKNPYFLRERQNRRVTVADFVINSELRVEKMMVNYLCHQPSKPRSVRLWRSMDSMPSPADVVSGKRVVGDGVDRQKRFVSQTFCPEESGA